MVGAHCVRPRAFIRPFCEAYLKMYEKAEEIGIENLPRMKEGQNQNIGEMFWNFFEKQDAEKMKELLREGQYIPQEILSGKDL